MLWHIHQKARQVVRILRPGLRDEVMPKIYDMGFSIIRCVGKIAKIRLELVLPTALTVAVLLLSVVYWDEASGITPNQCDAWSSGCGGSYVPWPSSPSGMCTGVMKPMNPVDRLICNLVRTKLYVLIVALQIVAVTWLGRFLAPHVVAPYGKNGVEENSKTR